MTAARACPVCRREDVRPDNDLRISRHPDKANNYPCPGSGEPWHTTKGDALL